MLHQAHHPAHRQAVVETYGFLAYTEGGILCDACAISC
jgi:hypothetical protein